MNKNLFKVFSSITILALMLAAVPMQSAQALSPDIVISQVYGGGGNSGATYTHDFIELFNRGTSSVSLAGWSVQYASATGTGNFGSSSTQLTELPSVSLAPGQYLVIQEAQGSGGTTPLPTPDVTDASPIPMSGTGGKVALVTSSTVLGVMASQIALLHSWRLSRTCLVGMAQISMKRHLHLQQPTQQRLLNSLMVVQRLIITPWILLPAHQLPVTLLHL